MPEPSKPAPDLTFRKYAVRVFRQFKTDVKNEVQPTVIAILAIIVVLAIQYWFGWIKVGEGWPTIFANLAPVLTIFLAYVAYHLIRAPYGMDKQLNEEAERQETELAQLTAHKLIFEIDLNNINVTVNQTNGATRIYTKIQLRFENKDVRPIAVKEVRLYLHRGATEIVTVWWFSSITSNGIQIKQEDFESILVPGGGVTPFYQLDIMLGVESEEIKRASDLDIGDFLLLTMRASGYQPELLARMRPNWEAAIKEGGTNLVTVTGVKTIPKDYRRLA